MGMTMVRCDDCGLEFFAPTCGQATALWREHFIHDHTDEETTDSRTEP